MMSNQKEKQTGTVELPLDGANDISDSDGDHHADGFENIGVLAKRILSRVKARKKTEEAIAAASSVSIAQASVGEDLASKPTDRTDVDASVERRESASHQYI
jgi:hypothetical protein